MNQILTVEDAQLLQRISQRDRLALSRFYDRYARTLYTTASRILGNPEEGAKVLEEVFLQIWKQAGTYDPGRGSPVQWALGLARQRAMDRLTAHGPRYSFIIDEVGLEPGAASSQRPGEPNESPALEPPTVLKERILAAMAPPPADAPTRSHRVGAQVEPWQNWLPWVFATGFVLLCVVLVFIGQSFRQQNAALLQQLNESTEHSNQLQAMRDNLQSQLDQLSTNSEQIAADFQNQLAQKTGDLQRQKADWQKQLEQQKADSHRQFTSVQRQLAQTVADKDRLSQELADAWASVSRDPFAQMRIGLLKPAADAPAKALAASIWDIGQQKGMLAVEGLPRLPSSRTYQLWLYDAKPPAAPINAALFNVDEQGSARIQFNRLAQPVEEVSRLVISTERRGGAATPTKVVLSSN